MANDREKDKVWAIVFAKTMRENPAKKEIQSLTLIAREATRLSIAVRAADEAVETDKSIHSWLDYWEMD